MAEIDQISDYLVKALTLEKEAAWLVQIFVIVLVTLLASFFAGKVMDRLHRKLEGTRSVWDNVAMDAAQKPVRLLVWILGIGYAVNVLYLETKAEIFSGADSLRDVLVIWVVAWGIIRFIKRFENHFIALRKSRGKPVDETTARAMGKIAMASVIISALLIGLQSLGLSVSGVLAFGGVGGIAIGFAARDLLANFFGAMMIYLDKPFRVGDWIRSPDKEIEGTVEDIGWRITTIRTFDKRPLYVPNSTFATISIENPSRMMHRRIYETIGVRYADLPKMRAITEAVKQMLISHPEIEEKQTLIVNFDAFNASSCDFFLYAFTHTTEWIRYHEIKQDVLLKVAEIIAGHEAEIAFPTRTLHVVNEQVEPQQLNIQEHKRQSANG